MTTAAETKVNKLKSVKFWVTLWAVALRCAACVYRRERMAKTDIQQGGRKMTAAVIGIAAALVMAAFAGSAFFIARIERRERKNGEKENAELRKHERDMAGSIADANAKRRQSR